MADDAVHEFKLDGKQLVFLFMAVTVVAVVVFLCGVMVGRGVRPRQSEAVMSAGGADPTADLPPVPSTLGTGTAGASPAAQEDLTYAERLDSKTALPTDTLTAAEAPVGEPMPDPTKQVPADAPAPQKAAAEPVRPADPGRPAQTAQTDGGKTAPKTAGTDPAADQAGSGPKWAVQVASIKGKAAADAMAARLVAKGYRAYVSQAAPGMFRVRVGPFADRREADATSSKLQKVDQFKPWVAKER